MNGRLNFAVWGVCRGQARGRAMLQNGGVALLAAFHFAFQSKMMVDLVISGRSRSFARSSTETPFSLS